MNEKFLAFLKLNEIEENDIMAQLYLSILEQTKKIDAIASAINELKDQENTGEKLKDIIRNNLVIGIEKAEVSIDYDKLAVAFRKVDKEKEKLPFSINMKRAREAC